MSFIGESREDYKCPWKDYVILDLEDCKLLLKSIQKEKAKALKTYLRYKDIHDGGESTERQETALINAEDRFDRLSCLLTDVEIFLKTKE